MRRTVAGRLTSIVACVAMAAAAVSGCGSEDDPGGSASSTGGSGAAKDVKVAFVAKAFTKNFWVRYGEGARAGGKQPGVEVEVTAAAKETDSQDQINKVESLLLKDIDALVLVPNSDELGPVVQKAIDEGVKVVFTNAGIPSVKGWSSYVGTDDKAAGRLGAEYLVKKLGKDVLAGGVGLLTEPQFEPVINRADGAKEVFAEHGIEVVAELPARNCNQLNGQNVAQDMLRAHPDMKVIYSMCGPPAIGAAQAAVEDGKKPNEDFFVLSYDGSQEEYEAIEQGLLLGTVDQQPFVQGKTAVETVIKAARGEAVEKQVQTPATVVNADNVKEFLAP